MEIGIRVDLAIPWGEIVIFPTKSTLTGITPITHVLAAVVSTEPLGYGCGGPDLETCA